jgi:hypothetical protein
MYAIWEEKLLGFDSSFVAVVMAVAVAVAEFVFDVY